MFFLYMLILSHLGALLTVLYPQHYDNDLILVIKHRKKNFIINFCAVLFLQARGFQRRSLDEE